MKCKSDPNLTTCEPRYSVGQDEDTQITVTRRGHDGSEPFPAELIDISHHGAKFGMSICPRFQESLRLQIDIPSRNVHYEGVAQVRNIRSNGTDGWLVGCAVQPPFSNAVHSRIAAAAGTNRRESPRQSISLSATLRRPLELDTTDARLLNVSAGGICVWSEAEVETGDRLSIGLVGPDQQAHSVEARVLWRMVAPDGCMAGCSFNNTSSYATVLSCIAEQPAEISKAIRAARPTSRLIMATAILAIVLPPALTIMLETHHAKATSEQAAQFDRIDTEAADDLAEVPPALSLLEEAAPASALIRADGPAAAAAGNGAPWRKFSDNTGRYHTMARVLDVVEDHILLRKQNGQWTNVPLHRLSPSCIEYVRQWQSSSR
jgi:PilZ domain-containing protein/SLA1 Homology Domain 1 (SHD1) protein